MTTTPPRRRGRARSRLWAAAASCVVVAGCPQPEPQSEECRVYLECFFRDGQSRYPTDGGPWDGGTIDDPATNEKVPFEIDYSGFATPEAQQALRDAYGEGGYCWRKSELDTEVRDECTRACAMALAADCDRHRIWTESGGTVGAPPACLNRDEPDDVLENHADSTRTCDEVRIVADGGTVP